MSRIVSGLGRVELSRGKTDGRARGESNCLGIVDGVDSVGFGVI